jgi:cytosine/adenosine deaminase-related metal-dependent hydrolase
MTHEPGKLFFKSALTPEGWRHDVLIAIDDGWITAVEADASPPPGVERLRGTALPGLGNVHSHGTWRPARRRVLVLARGHVPAGRAALAG